MTRLWVGIPLLGFFALAVCRGDLETAVAEPSENASHAYRLVRGAVRARLQHPFRVVQVTCSRLEGVLEKILTASSGQGSARVEVFWDGCEATPSSLAHLLKPLFGETTSAVILASDFGRFGTHAESYLGMELTTGQHTTRHLWKYACEADAHVIQCRSGGFLSLRAQRWKIPELIGIPAADGVEISAELSFLPESERQP